jgi:hypothetical protein
MATLMFLGIPADKGVGMVESYAD